MSVRDDSLEQGSEIGFVIDVVHSAIKTQVAKQTAVVGSLPPTGEVMPKIKRGIQAKV